MKTGYKSDLYKGSYELIYIVKTIPQTVASLTRSVVCYCARSADVSDSLQWFTKDIVLAAVLLMAITWVICFRIFAIDNAKPNPE